ncbi:hypothetical protein FAI40_03445 [Acetobacteraceae bacterium]|nr:hypothetical protein FAI40_03445 [Acetobacteraceae bacterium]
MSEKQGIPEENVQEIPAKEAPFLKRFYQHAKAEIRADFKRSNIVGVPYFITRGVEVNYFFIVPSVSTLAFLMLIFVPLHRYPVELISKTSLILVLLSNVFSLIAVAIWRWAIDRHYKEIIEARRKAATGKAAQKSFLNNAARFASPFLTPDNAHPARHLLGLWARDNVVYILPSVAVVALFPADVVMLDPVMEVGISSIFTYLILFWVMGNLLSFLAFGLFFAARWGAKMILRVTHFLTGANYLERH